MYTASLWLAFRASIQEGRALEHGFVLLNSTIHIATPTGNTCIPEASEIRMLLYSGHAVDVHMVSTLEGLHFT